MLDTLTQTALNTPWWVYVLLVVLILIGFKASKTSVVSLHKLMVVPLLFTYMALETLLNNLSLTPMVFGIFFSSLLIGTLAGWFQVSRLTLAFDKSKKLIKIPGSWNVLILALVFFGVKYYFGYELSVDPDIIHNSYFELAFIGITAICTGIFIGKFLCYWRRMQTEPSTELT